MCPTVLRVLNTIDYTLVNEMTKIERSTATMVTISRILFDFLHFVSNPSAFMKLSKYEIGWNEFCQVVRRNITNCLYEFKERVKNIVTNPQAVPSEAKENLKILKDSFLAPNLK